MRLVQLVSRPNDGRIELAPSLGVGTLGEAPDILGGQSVIEADSRVRRPLVLASRQPCDPALEIALGEWSPERI